MKTKEQKRIEAEVRQEEYQALDPLAKLDRLSARPGLSKRERERLALEAEAAR